MFPPRPRFVGPGALRFAKRQGMSKYEATSRRADRANVSADGGYSYELERADRNSCRWDFLPVDPRLILFFAHSCHQRFAHHCRALRNGASTKKAAANYLH